MVPAMLDVWLREGRDRSVRRRHPWVLSGSVERVVGEEEAGAFTAVRSAAGEVLGYGHYAPGSAIRVRLLHFGPEAEDEAGLRRLLVRAIARRAEPGAAPDSDAVRLVNAEGDGVPGLTVDRYADVVVARVGSAGMARRLSVVREVLESWSGASRGVVRSDAVAARREGFGQLQGALYGALPEEPVTIREGSRLYRVDTVHGQKTGFYLDQRESRARVVALAAGRRVLDLFAYTGGFGVAAAAGRAREVSVVEESPAALELARENFRRNGLATPVEWIRADAFRFLRRHPDRRYDLIVVDPPPLARSRGELPRALRAAKDLLLYAFRAGAPGARILAFSCSHHLGAELLRKVAFGASLDARRPARVLAELGAPPDHPVSLDHPEGRYLSGLLLEL